LGHFYDDWVDPAREAHTGTGMSASQPQPPSSESRWIWARGACEEPSARRGRLNKRSAHHCIGAMGWARATGLGKTRRTRPPSEVSRRGWDDFVAMEPAIRAAIHPRQGHTPPFAPAEVDITESNLTARAACAV